MKLISLQDESKMKIVPYMLDMLISEQIPIANRIEVALKAAFLREASILVMDRLNALNCLEDLLRVNPGSFSTKFHQLLGAEPINALDFLKSTQEEKEEKEEEKMNNIKQISAGEYKISFKKGISKLPKISIHTYL